MKAIEKDFPFEQIDSIAEMESYRKEINRPIYHIHKWWAKRLGSVFRSIIIGAVEDDWNNFYEKINSNGKVVLDPFMGSGTTVGEATKLGCKVIGCDINPVSTFLVNQALTRVDTNVLKEEYLSIENDVSTLIKSYYKTKIEGYQEPCEVLYYFWVKVVTTNSGEEIPLFSKYIFSKDAYPQKKPEAKVVCPSCRAIFSCRYDSVEEVCPTCKNVFNPQKGSVNASKVYDSTGKEYKIKDLVQSYGKPIKHALFAIMALTPRGEKIYLKPKSDDIELFEKAAADLKQIESRLPLPKMSVRKGHNTNQAIGYNYLEWKNFFNSRQLLCLGLLYERILSIKNKKIREQFVTLFSSTLEFNNLFCSFKGEGTGAVRHMFSNHILKPEKTPLENNVWGTHKSSGSFSTLFKSKLLKAKEYLDFPFEIKIVQEKGVKTTKKLLCSDIIDVRIVNEWDNFEKSDVLLLNGDSGHLPIPNASVDAVVTDPPYFDFIHYSELSDFFYAWLREGLQSEYSYFRKNNSSDKNEVQDKDANSFSMKIEKIFSECYRVLKYEGLLCFSYHHSTVDGWLAIYKAIINANFDIVAAHPVKAEMDVSSPKSATKNPINLDSILVCKKQEKLTITSDIIDDILSSYSSYIARFDSLERRLSEADKFVIACSQTLVQASVRRFTIVQTKEIIMNVLNQLPNHPIKKKTMSFDHTDINTLKNKKSVLSFVNSVRN